jgi:uncharacterized protein YyaL (SSP411 family)
MSAELEKIYDDLFLYCRKDDFAGHDPFDGLNSRLFQSTPLKYAAPARLAWLQMIKRVPMDLRTALRVPKDVNPKGLALFTLAELSRFRASGNSRHADEAKSLAERLIEASIVLQTSNGASTRAFGYNFDWQSRSFYAPIGTPAIVPTAFASQALVEMYGVFEDERYLTIATEICEFILNGLNRSSDSDDEVCFSYTPNDKSVIYNASLLAGESLARVGAVTQDAGYLASAAKTVRFVTRRQRGDGSWVYGANAKQAWSDNFHTAYVLQSLFRISSLIPGLRSETYTAIKTGVDFWLDSFFLEDGTPKYYSSETYPIDIHSAAVAIAVLAELNAIDNRMLPLARKTAEWTIENMRSPEGFFYYQIRKDRIIKTPFMRWGQAWMAYALSRLIEAESANSDQ